TPRPSLGFGLLIIKPFSSILFKILERLVPSMPIFGPNVVEDDPDSGSILNKVKPMAIVLCSLAASSLYIFATACQVALSTKSIVLSFIILIWSYPNIQIIYYACIVN